MTTSTLTLTDFLLARVAEDEAEVREVVRHGEVLVSPDGEDDPWISGEMNGVPSVVLTAERGLAECRAKIRIVANFEGSERALMNARERDANDKSVRSMLSANVAEAMHLAHSDAIRALAAVYADHPDYRSEWAS